MNFAESRYLMLPRPVWILAIVLGFWFWWPVGLAVLMYRLATKRYAKGEQLGRTGGWQMPDMMCRATKGFSFTPPSGNRAFDEYRSETLRRLEDEQKEFVDYLDRLRQARDRQEFEQFMAERRQRPARTDDTPQS
jgi:hypothetical protein